MTEREKQLEKDLASALRRIEAMKPFTCGSMTCKDRTKVKVCKNCGSLVS